MIRIMENNSKEETRTLQMEELSTHFESSGYSRQELEELKQKAILKTTTPDSTNSESNSDKTLVFPLYYMI